MVEMVASALAIRCPKTFFVPHILPALRNYDQQPQCAMSYLIVATCVIEKLGSSSPNSDTSQLSQPQLLSVVENDLSISVATWLGAPDGLARTIAQYAMFAITRALEGRDVNPYVTEQIVFLTKNRKCSKMREKHRATRNYAW